MVIGNSSVKVVLELVVYDLWGKFYRVFLYKLFGGGKLELKIDIIISVDNIDKMFNDC